MTYLLPLAFKKGIMVHYDLGMKGHVIWGIQVLHYLIIIPSLKANFKK